MIAIPDKEFWLEACLSIVCGLVVGIERQIHRKPIDIRTCVLICLGTTVFILLSREVEGDKDPTRVLGQIITGIGFLGAGAIFTRQGYVVGLTSASVVWILAAIGAAIGFGLYSIGLWVTAITILSLAVLQWVEQWTEGLNRPSKRG